MNTHEFRTIQRRIDLNEEPRDHEGTSVSLRTLTGNIQGESLLFKPALTMIDVDAIEDDVIESSASAFAEAKNKSKSVRRRPLMVDLESGGMTRLPANISNKRRRVPSSQPVIDCEHTPVNVFEVNMSSIVSPPPPPPPEEPKFTCPICMCPFTEEMSTKCGHIFCKECIKTAISRRAKCPTCRKKVTVKELIRVFLPSTR